MDLKSVKEKLLGEIGFSWNVMCKLFEPGIWIDRYLLVELDARQMTAIKDRVEDLRPGKLTKFELLALKFFLRSRIINQIN